MNNQKPSADEVQAYLTRMQNPYAFLSIQEQEQADQEAKEVSVAEKVEYLRKRKNPYAYYEFSLDADFAQEPCVSGASELKVKEQHPTPPVAVSKKGFQERCRRIFMMYVPPEEGNTLRPHYRDFIIRNQDQPPEQRSRILEELRKYDLSTTGNLKPHFNRERENLTQRKLEQIERVAGVRK
jgi:hypothetical protein